MIAGCTRRTRSWHSTRRPGGSTSRASASSSDTERPAGQGLFPRCTLGAEVRQIAGYTVEERVQPLQVVGLEACEYRGLVDLCKRVQRVQHGLRGWRQIKAVRTAVARVLVSPEIPLIAKPIDQSARGDLPDFERFRDRPLRCTGVARDRRDQGPLGPGQPALFDALIERYAQLASDHR